MGKHPNIVAVYDLGQEGALFYYAMELIEGKDLEHVPRERPFAFEEAARLVERLAKALQHAHEHQIIHRDLKPANVLIRTDGEPQVIDFGIARDMSSEANLSVTGYAMGSPNFMAPEQAHGQHDQCDARTDVYGLGGILYHVLTGYSPHPGPDRDEVVGDIRSGKEIIPPHFLRSNLPRDLDTICLKCLEAEQGRRYASAEDLAEDLARFQRGEPVVARPVSLASRTWRRAVRHWRVVVPSAVAVGVAVAFGLYAIVSQLRHIRVLGAEQGKTQAALRRTEGALVIAEEAKAAAQASEDRERKLKRRSRAEAERLKAEREENAGNRMSALAHAIAGMRVNRLGFGSAEKAWHLRSVAPSVEWCTPRPVDGGRIGSVSFSPDGTLVASGCGDYVIRLYGVLTGEESGSLRGHRGAVASLCFSSDGKRLVSGSCDRTVRLWDVGTGRELACLRGHSQAPGKSGFGWVSDVAFSPDGTRIVSGGDDYTVRLWETATGREERCLQGHTERVTSVAFGPEGTRVASGSWDKTVRLWEVATGKEVACLRGHDAVESVAFSPEGDLVVAGEYSAIRLWDLITRREVARFVVDPEAVSFAFSTDGKRVVSGHRDNTVRTWDIGSRTEVMRLFDALQARRDPPVWDIGSGTEVMRLEGHARSVNSVAVSKDGTRVASSSDDGTVRLWGAPKGRVLVALDSPELEVCSVAFSIDGRRVVSGENSKDNAVRVWDAVSGKQLVYLQGQTTLMMSVAFSSDGGRVVSRGIDSVRLWDVATGMELACLREHDSNPGVEDLADVNDVAFSPDGTRIVSGGDDCTVRLWDSATGKEVCCLQGHTKAVSSVGFSPDGTRIASGSSDGTVRLWDLAASKELIRLQANTDDTVFRVVFSPEGLMLASEGPDGVLLWDTTTGTRVLGRGAAEAEALLDEWWPPERSRPPTYLPEVGAVILEGEAEWRTAWCDPERDENGLPRKVARILDRWERDIGIRVDLETGEVVRIPCPGPAYANDARIAPSCK